MSAKTRKDPVDELDREEEVAIAAVVRARFRDGDMRRARDAMETVTKKRLRLRDMQAARPYAKG